MIHVPSLWMGSPEAYLRLVTAAMDLRAAPAPLELLRARGITVGLFSSDDDDDDGWDETKFLAEQLIEKHGSVGVVKIDGSLTNETSIWNLFSGAISYDTITLAAQMLNADEGVSHVVLRWGSGGGDADGMEQFSTNLKLLGKEKPYYSAVTPMALSAAYWGATAHGGPIVASRMSQVGSIGAVSTHRSIHRMLQEAGIDVTVFRGGEFKALGHPAEPLSDKAAAEIQRRTDMYERFFVDAIAENRGLDISAKGDWAEGRVFFAEEGLRLGLVDKIQTVNDLIMSLNRQAQASAASNNPTAGSGGIIRTAAEDLGMKKTIVLNDAAALAAAAAGAPVDQLQHSVEEAPEASATEEPGQTQAKAEEPTSGQSPATLEEAAPSALEAHLKGENTRLQEQVVALTVELQTVKSKATEDANAVAALRTVALEAVQRFNIALGVPVSAGTTELSTAALLSQYSNLKSAFESRYKIGRQSLAADAAEPLPPEQQAARLNIFPVNETKTAGARR